MNGFINEWTCVYDQSIVHYSAYHCWNSNVRWFNDDGLIPLTNATRIVSTSVYRVYLYVTCWRNRSRLRSDAPVFETRRFGRPSSDAAQIGLGDLRCPFVQDSFNKNLKLHVTHKFFFNVSWYVNISKFSKTWSFFYFWKTFHHIYVYRRFIL